MSTIRFSSAYIGASITTGNTAATPLWSSGAITTSSVISGSNAGLGVTISQIFIYKGTQPDWTTLTDRSTRAADLLITMTLPNYAQSQPFTSIGLVGTSYRWLIGKVPTPTAASASGTASWFILCRSGTTSMTDKAALMGSVGVLGSGSDLEVPSTSIISGNNYTSAGIYMNMPLNWTV
jgi:hypothetical protein